MRICVFGNKTTTKVLLEKLMSLGIKVEFLVTLPQKVANKIEISGRDTSLEEYATENGIKIYLPEKYLLNSPDDFAFFRNHRFDLGLCTGWQRIIQNDILKTFSYGIFGWHGSAFGLPNGRGRSPLNWSIRLGMKQIYHNCFQYSEHADSGKIFETEILEILENDYISDLQAKAVVHMAASANRLVKSIKTNKLVLESQPDHPSIFFPSLNEAAGKLDPSILTCDQALNIIKSCSYPFPGAFVVDGHTKFRIWKATHNKQQHLSAKKSVFLRNNQLIIITKDGSLISDSFELLHTN